MNSQPLILVLHGPSGVGKDTVIDELRRRTGIHRATSSTSREPRPGEEDGVDYHFYSREEFERKRDAGEFAESALVYGDWKGVEWAEIDGPLQRGVDVIIRTDVQGARTWRERLDGAVFIFLMAEDREVIRARLMERGTEDGESLARRLAELEAELADIENNDYVVINAHGELDEAVREIARIIEIERANAGRRAATIRSS